MEILKALFAITFAVYFYVLTAAYGIALIMPQFSEYVFGGAMILSSIISSVIFVREIGMDK